MPAMPHMVVWRQPRFDAGTEIAAEAAPTGFSWFDAVVAVVGAPLGAIAEVADEDRIAADAAPTGSPRFDAAVAVVGAPSGAIAVIAGEDGIAADAAPTGGGAAASRRG